MELYVKNYPAGYEDLPSENTPVTSDVMDKIEQGIYDASANNIKLDNVTKYITATAGSNGDFKVNVTNTLATGMIINITVPAATNGASNARFSVDNGVNYKNFKNVLGTQLIASVIASKNITAYYNGTDFIVIDGIYTPATETEIATGTDENKIITPKELSDADLNTRLKSKRLNTSRDGQGASGNVSYTGIGFKPRAVQCLAYVDGTLYNSNGFCDSDLNNQAIYQSSANVCHGIDQLIAYTNYSSWAQNGKIISFDNDGFTIQWSKAGTPTAGTITMYFICYK